MFKNNKEKKGNSYKIFIQKNLLVIVKMSVPSIVDFDIIYFLSETVNITPCINTCI